MVVFGLNIALKTFASYVDDSQAKFKARGQLFNNPEQSRYIDTMHDGIRKSKQAAQVS